MTGGAAGRFGGGAVGADGRGGAGGGACGIETAGVGSSLDWIRGVDADGAFSDSSLVSDVGS